MSLHEELPPYGAGLSAQMNHMGEVQVGKSSAYMSKPDKIFSICAVISLQVSDEGKVVAQLAASYCFHSGAGRS